MLEIDNAVPKVQVRPIWALNAARLNESLAALLQYPLREDLDNDEKEDNYSVFHFLSQTIIYDSKNKGWIKKKER